MLRTLRAATRALLFRQIARELTAVRAELAAHNALLARLVEHVCPAPADSDRTVVRGETGVSFLDPIEAGLSLDYISRTERDTGHTPSEDEILIHLADEKTADLRARLVARDEELARLAAAWAAER